MEFARPLGSIRLVLVCALFALRAPGFATAAPQLNAARLHVVLETHLAGETDAERIATPKDVFVPGKPVVVRGRLARLTLSLRPWEGDVWQVRYVLEPLAGARGSQTGVFSLRENERKELWLGGAPASRKGSALAVHGVRLELTAPRGAGLTL